MGIIMGGQNSGKQLSWRTLKQSQIFQAVDQLAFTALCRLIPNDSLFQLNFDACGPIYKNQESFPGKNGHWSITFTMLEKEIEQNIYIVYLNVHDTNYNMGQHNLHHMQRFRLKKEICIGDNIQYLDIQKWSTSSSGFDLQTCLTYFSRVGSQHLISNAHHPCCSLCCPLHGTPEMLLPNCCSLVLSKR